MLTPEQRIEKLKGLQPEQDYSTFGGALKDFGAGLGLSVVKGVEGVFELGNIVPGVDYDLGLVDEVKDIFDYEESDSFAEQAGEFGGFLASLFTGAGAVGKAASLTGKLAKSSKTLRGYNNTRAAQATHALLKKHPKTAAFMKTEAKFAMADFLVTSGDDAFDVVTMLGLDDTAIVEHFAIEEGESELSRRLKGAMQGFALGIPFEFALKGGAFAATKGKDAIIKGADKARELNQQLGNKGSLDFFGPGGRDPEDLPKKSDDPVDPDAPDAPDGPTMLFDKSQVDEGTKAPATDYDVQNTANMVVELARSLDAIGEATGKEGKIVDLSYSMKHASPQTQEAATHLGNSIVRARVDVELAIKEGKVKGDELDEAKQKLIELRRMESELEEKVPGLFRGKTAVEHNKVVDDILERKGEAGITAKTAPDVPPTIKTVSEEEAKALREAAKLLKGESKQKITQDDLTSAYNVLSRNESPEVQMSLLELAAYRGKAVYDLADKEFEALRNEYKEVLGSNKEEELLAYAKQTSEATGSDYKRVYDLYASKTNGIAADILELDEMEITGAFTKEKKMLAIAQKLDQLDTMFDAFKGLVRPKELHKKRNLASLSFEEIMEMSPTAVERELRRSASSRRYNMDIIRDIQKTLKDQKYNISAVDLMDRMMNGKFAGWTQKAAELNIAMIMANVRLLGSNLIQNWLKGQTDKGARWLGSKIVGGNISPVNRVALHKTRSTISLWNQFVKASFKGQRRRGTGSLLAGLDASREVKPQVSSFKDQNMAREIGFLTASATDDGTKAMVLLADTLDALSARKDLSSKQLDIIQENLPDIISKRLEIGGSIRQKDLAEDVVSVVKDTELESPRVKEDYATLETEVEKIFNKAFQNAKDRTFTEFRDKASIQEEHGTVLAAMAQTVRGIAEFTEDLPGVGPLVRTVVSPFVNTPINAVLYGSSFTPFSKSYRRAFVGQLNKFGVKTDFPSVKKLFGEFDSNNPEHVRAMGKFWIGNSIMATTLMLHQSGLVEVTGRGPDEPNARKEWLKAGNQPYSIKLGAIDKTISLKRLGPTAAPFMVAAELKEVFADNPWSDEALSDDIAGMMAALGESVMGMSSLDSSANLLDAIVNQDKGAINQIVASLALPAIGAAPRLGSLATTLPGVSSAGSAVSQFFAPEERVPGSNMIDSVVLSIKNRYARFAADKRRNAFGEVLEVNPIDAMFSLAAPIMDFRTVRDGRVDKELAELNYPVSKVKHIMNGLNLTDDKYRMGDQSAYDKYQELLGTTRVGGRTLVQALDKTIRSRKYGKLPKEGAPDIGLASPRVLEIRKIFATYRAAAKEELLKDNRLLKGDLNRVEAASLALKTGRSPETIISDLFEL